MTLYHVLYAMSSLITLVKHINITSPLHHHGSNSSHKCTCGLITYVSRYKHLLVHLSCHSITKTKQGPYMLNNPLPPPSLMGGDNHQEWQESCSSIWSLSKRKSSAGWRSAPALSPKMRRGLSVLLVAIWRNEHKNTQEFRVVWAAGA
jgi:hypothetical protein